MYSKKYKKTQMEIR